MEDNKSSITFMNRLPAEMRVRGYNILDLAKHASYEEMTYLLWYGMLPRTVELKRLQKQLIESRKLSKKMMDHLESLPKHIHLMDGIRSAVSLMSHYDPDTHDTCAAANLRKATRITATLPSIALTIHRLQNNKEPLPPKASGSQAANILYMLQGEQPTAQQEQLLTLALNITADQGLCPSTAAARTATAAGADMHSAILAAMTALRGVRHGGAIEASRKLVHEIGEPKDATPALTARLKTDRIPGFGHPVFNPDPRASLLRDYARISCSGKKKLFEVAEAMSCTMEIEKDMHPNVMLYLGLLHESLDIPYELSTPLLATSMVPGWCAHIIEESSEHQMAIPAPMYSGPQPIEWQPMKKRR